LNALEAEASFAQGVTDSGNVGCAAGFQSYVNDGFAEADAVIGAVVDGFDDVGTLLGEDLGEGEECAGTVLQVDTDAEQTAVFDQAALNNLGQQGDVDIAAADKDHGAAMAKVGLRLDDSG